MAEQMDTFDSIGFLHNEMLDYFGYFMRDTLNMYAERGEMNECELNNLTNRFFEKGLEFSIMHGVTERTPLMVDAYYRMIGSDTSIVDSLLGNSIHDFEQLLSSLDFDNVDNAVRQLSHAKENVCSNMQTFEDTTLAIMISVYKFSLRYWNDVSNDIQSPWYEFYHSQIDVNDSGSCSDYHTANNVKKVFKKIGNFFSNIFNSVVNSKTFEVAATDVVSAVLNYAYLSVVPTIDPISNGAKLVCSAVDGAVMSYLASK